MLFTAKLVIFLCSVISQGKVVALDRWGGKWNQLSMTHRLTTNYAKNYCNRTLIVKVIVENVVTCFLGDTVYTYQQPNNLLVSVKWLVVRSEIIFYPLTATKTLTLTYMDIKIHLVFDLSAADPRCKTKQLIRHCLTTVKTLKKLAERASPANTSNTVGIHYTCWITNVGILWWYVSCFNNSRNTWH